MSVNTWNTAPDYDQWGYDTSWSCEDWMQWHGQLLAKFGKDRAKLIWDYAYAKSGSLSSNLDCRTFNSAFKQYVAKNNLDPLANAGMYAPVLGGINAVSDLSANVLKSLNSLTTGNTMKTIVTIVVFGGVVFGGAYVYRTFKK